MCDRNKIIIERILNGDKYKDIAADFGVTKQCIQQIYRKYRAELAYNESTSDLERLAIKITGYGFNYQALMCMFNNSKVYTLRDLLDISTDELLEEKNRCEVMDDGKKIIHGYFGDIEFYRKHIESMKKKAAKIIAKKEES